MAKILKWLPRALAIAYIIFISIFALDVFGQHNFWKTIIALFMHLIPSYLLTGILIWAWHKPKYGGAAYIALSIIFTIWFNTYRNIFSLLFISGIPLLIGILFLLSTKK